MTTRRRWIGAVALVGVGVLATLGALRLTRARAAAAVSSDDPLVPTARVTRGPLELSVHATGELRASKSAMLIAPSVGGTLRILKLVETGTAVKAGDVIVELDPTEQFYALEQAKSELDEAEQQIVKKKADLDVQVSGGRGDAPHGEVRRPPGGAGQPRRQGSRSRPMRSRRTNWSWMRRSSGSRRSKAT